LGIQKVHAWFLYEGIDDVGITRVGEKWVTQQPRQREEHGLSDAGELRQLATDAGFQEANVVPAIQIIRYSETREYVRVQLIATPQAGLLSGMGGEQREAIFDAIATDMNAFLGSPDGGFASPQEAHILLARK